MEEKAEALYAAFKAKDPRFDGRFFVGIASTGIYCRPVCRARQPKIESCTFYRTAAEAEQAGYRPCLLCRPELAPGMAGTDASANLIYRAARLLEENCGSGQSVDELAGRLGYTGRHLRRVFAAEYNVPPVRYLQTCRLLLAKSLLTDTKLPVLEVAMAAGFGSLRRFNGLFKKRYNLTPGALRKKASEGKKQSGGITLALGYRPPYRWDEMLGFLSGRAIAGVEAVRNGEYLRTVHLKSPEGKPLYGWVRVGHSPERRALTVTVDEALLPVLSQVLSRVRHLFDLYCDPAAVYETLRAMNGIRPGLCAPGTRLPGSFYPFETAVLAVLGQREQGRKERGKPKKQEKQGQEREREQEKEGRERERASAKAPSDLAAGIAAAYGKPVETGIEGLTRAFPSPEDIWRPGGSAEDRSAESNPAEGCPGLSGVTEAQAKTVYALARAAAQGEIDFEARTRRPAEIKNLAAIRGVGDRTARYIAMRTMEWPDVFLETDAGVRGALPGYSPKGLAELAEAWSPWRSYATVNLWYAPPCPPEGL